MIITISRRTGSGGHTIGKTLAEKLGYDFYDKEIISQVARSMNVDTSLFTVEQTIDLTLYALKKYQEGKINA